MRSKSNTQEPSLSRFVSALTLLNILCFTIIYPNTAKANIIAAGGEHSAVILDGAGLGAAPGAIWTWGENRDGQLGKGDQTDAIAPVKIDTDLTWDDISSGIEHTVAIKDGKLFGWGSNRTGQLGLGLVAGVLPEGPLVETQIGTAENWVNVEAGDFYTLLLNDLGELWACGSNQSGQLGIRGKAAQLSLVRVDAPNTYSVVSAGRNHTLAIRTDGTLWSWGSNLEGQLGIGPVDEANPGNGESDIPRQVILNGTDAIQTGWIAVAAGGSHSLAIQEEGTPGQGALWAFGRNLEGQLGNLILQEFKPVKIMKTKTDWKQIEAGFRHSLAIDSDGSLFAFGYNTFGQLGIGSETDAHVPEQVTDGTTQPKIVDISAGKFHSLMVDEGGNVFGAGDNSHSQLGIAGISKISSFAKITFLDTGNTDPPSDFIVAEVNISSESKQFTLGQLVSYNVTVTNIGDTFAEQDDPVEVQLLLSSDAVLDGGDSLLDTLSFIDLEKSASTTLNGTFNVTSNIDAGTYFFIANVDSGGLVEELNEGNNTFVTADEFEVFTPPDFEIAEVTVTLDNPRPLQSVSFDLRIANNASTYPGESADVPVRVFLSANESEESDADNIEVGTFNMSSGVPGGGSVSLSHTTFLPREIAANSYYFVFQINPDPNDEIDETDLTNNFAFSEETFGLFPDLVVDFNDVEAAQVLPGDDLGFDLEIENIGSNFLDKQFLVEILIVLTDDTVIGDEDDIFLKTLSFDDGLEFLENEFFFNETLTIPSTIPSGTYQMGFLVNSNNGIADEVDKENNDTLSPVQFRFFPDFIISQFNIPDAEIIPGTNIGFKVTTINQGGNFAFETTAVSVGIHLSQDEVFGNIDDVALIGSIDHSADLNSGASFTDSKVFQLPDLIPTGTYKIIAKADAGNLVEEQEEANNTAISVQQFTLLADVQSTNFSYTGGDYNRGDTIPIADLSIANNSPFQITEGTDINVQVRISKDLIWGNFDDLILVEDLVLDSPAEFLAGGGSLSQAIGEAVVPAETPAGQYFIGVRIDNFDTISEVDDTNNTLFSDNNDITVLGISLGEALEETLPDPVGVKPGFGEKRNLNPILGGAASWFSQDIVTHPSGGANAGQAGRIGDSQETFFEISLFEEERFELSFDWKVSSEESFDFLELRINGDEEDSISGVDGDWVHFSKILEAGSYTFKIVYRKDENEAKGEDTGWVDNFAINEAPAPTNENPDFVIVNAEYTPGTFIVQGATLAFNAIGINAGGDLLPTTLPLQVDVILSTDREFGNGDDIVLETLKIVELLAEEDQFVYSNIIQIPETNRSGQVVPASAPYYLGMRVDPPTPEKPKGNFEELSESNNIFWSSQADILVETRPDLTFENFDYVEGQYSYGDEILMSFDLINSGLRTIPSVNEGGQPIEMKVVLGGGNQVDTLATFSYSEGLKIGERRFIQMSVDVPDDFPITEGCGILNVQGDTSEILEESREGNNSTANVVIDTLVSGIDVGEAIDLPQLRWVQGGSFCTPWTGQEDNSLDFTDSVKAPSSIPPGASASLTTSLFIEDTSVFSFAINGGTVVRIFKNGDIDQERFVEGGEGGIFFVYNFTLEGGAFYDIQFIHGDLVVLKGIVRNDEFFEVGEPFSVGGAATIDLATLFLPEIHVDEFVFSDPDLVYSRGDVIDMTGVSLKVSNTGQRSIPPNTPLVFQFALTKDLTFGNEDDILIRSNVLGFLRDTHIVKLDQPLNSGVPSASVQVAELFNLAIPEYISPGKYILAVRALAENTVLIGGDTESIAFTSTQVVTIEEGGSAISIAEGLDHDGLVTRPTSEVPWFGFKSSDGIEGSDTFDGIDAVATPYLDEGKDTSIEVRVTGPADITFRWKANTLEILNSLNFFVDDEISKRISGNVDWTEERTSLSAGEHVLRWNYLKGKNTENPDHGVVDQFKIERLDIEMIDVVYADGATLNRGDDLAVSVFLKNSGDSFISASLGLQGSLSISQDALIGNVDDVSLGTFTIDQDLPVGATVEFPLSFPIPSSANPGDYGVSAAVDVTGLLNEVDEGNNEILKDLAVAKFTVDPATAVPVTDGLDLTIDPPVAAPEIVLSGTSSWFATSATPPEFVDGDVASSPALENVGDTASFEFSLPGPFRISFDYLIRSAADEFTFSLDGEEKLSVAGDRDVTNFEIIVPAGDSDRVLTWTYTRNSTSVADPDAVLYINNVTVFGIDEPDLVITDLDVTSGTYNLDVTQVSGASLVGTKFLELIVNIENQGVDLLTPGFFQVSDLEVRLSVDNIYGNADDIPLGEFAQVEQNFEGGDKVKFLGPIPLGDDIPAGDYYVIARVDPKGQVAEFDENNNIAVTDSASVSVARLADLELTAASISFDENKVLFPGESMSLGFDIHNLGLGDIPGSVEWDVTVKLRAIENGIIQAFRDDPARLTVDAFDGSSTAPIILGSFSQKSLMLGRRNDAALGDTIEVGTFFTLPHAVRIQNLIGEDKAISDFSFWFEVELDTTDQIQESDEQNRILIFSIANILVPENSRFDLLFSISNELSSITAANWTGLYEGPDADGGDDDGDGLINKLEYAFNRNPLVNDASALLPVTFGKTSINSQEFLKISFDFVYKATDLTYKVEVADDIGGPYTTILTLTPPYTAQVGASSLTGDGGLTSDPLVIQAVDLGYSARITVKDEEPVDGASRFMKITVE